MWYISNTNGAGEIRTRGGISVPHCFVRAAQSSALARLRPLPRWFGCKDPAGLSLFIITILSDCKEYILKKYSFLKIFFCTLFGLGVILQKKERRISMAQKKKTHGKSKSRSPSYPIIGLQEAVTKIEDLYDREGMNYVHKELAVKGWGYKSLHGIALQLLSSLYQYGLIERNIGQIKLSQDAFAILKAPENSVEKQKAIQRCARAPTIFKEILTEYSGKLPSDENLKWWLRKKKFSESSASTIIECLKETKSFAKLGKKEYNEGGEQKTDDEYIKKDNETPPTEIDIPGTENNVGEAVRYSFPYRGKAATLIFPGGEPLQEELGRIISILEACKPSLRIKNESRRQENGKE